MRKLCPLLLLAALNCAAQTFQHLYYFLGYPVDAQSLMGKLTRDGRGTLYGTSEYGGSFDFGTVFAATPPLTAGGRWTESILYSFNDQDGALPLSDVTIGSDGSLYGTTFFGGPYDNGTVFELTPPAAPGGTWTHTTLVNFGLFGGAPSGGVLLGKDGRLYGMASYSGIAGFGFVFSLTPPSHAGDPWTLTVLHLFTGGIDGSQPAGDLLFGPDGALYGATAFGGNFSTFCLESCGTIFQLTPPPGGIGEWTKSNLHTFTTPGDGKLPVGSLTLGRNGELYGSTTEGGSANGGTAFELLPAIPAGGWTESVLYSFTPAPGVHPNPSPLTLGPEGSLYGTTQSLEDVGTTGHLGAAFRLVAPAVAGGAWTPEILHSFQGHLDGWEPAPGLTLGDEGAIYGATSQGGAAGFGVLYQIKP